MVTCDHEEKRKQKSDLKHIAVIKRSSLLIFVIKKGSQRMFDALQESFILLQRLIQKKVKVWTLASVYE